MLRPHIAGDESHQNLIIYTIFPFWYENPVHWGTPFYIDIGVILHVP